MRVEVFSLCNAATADAGKLNMLGAFDAIRAAKMPVVQGNGKCKMMDRRMKIKSSASKPNLMNSR